ncbi:MAG TPA: lipoate--protein ligase family protein [Pirellulales bacterium]|nr:lipoate--protein ligase family protein [Pirellulales bacterium]
MYFLNHTCRLPAENLALDEALLTHAEGRDDTFEVLRLWEPAEPMVVAGRSSRVANEVNLPYCREQGVPVFRRSSGGAAIVTGPGCLMYAVVLDFRRRPELRAIDSAHRFVMTTLQSALGRWLPAIAWQGTCDLTVGGRKFSGNSLRCVRNHLLYHGTLLYDFPLERIARCLGTPPREPEYRDHRPHERFVTNVAIGREQLTAALVDAWQADEPFHGALDHCITELVAAKYSRDEWNLKL